VRKLIALGLRPDKARMAAYINRGPWRTSVNPAINTALGNDYWSKRGLINLSLKHLEIRKSW